MPPTEAPPKPDTGAIPQGALDESFSEIEGLDDTKPTEPEKPKPAAKVEPEKKPESPKKPEPTDEFSEPDQPTPPEKKAEKPPDKPIKIPELRVAFEKAKSRISELEAQIEQAKTATPTADPEKPKLQSQVQERDQKIEALERRIAEQEKVIQFADYQSSDEYKSKYETPYTDAFKRALSEFEQLTVTITDADGNQTARKATVNDLLALQNMPLGEVDALAEGMFGKSAPPRDTACRAFTRPGRVQERRADQRPESGSGKADATDRASEGRVGEARQTVERHQQAISREIPEMVWTNRRRQGR